MFKYKIKQNNKLNVNSTAGFSLVEMLVAIGIFMSIMTIAISSLISIIGANKKAQAIKNTIDSVTFAVEDISRDMRTGTGYECFDGDNWSQSCDLANGSTAVSYVNSSGNAVIYKFNGTGDLTKGVLTKTECSGPSICDVTQDNTVDLISQDSNVNITGMNFYVIGAFCENISHPNCTVKTQPRLIITISGLISVKGSDNTSFNLQTSISQRARL